MTENIRQHVKSIVHDTRNCVNDGMKCVGKGLWHEDCIIHYRKTAETAFLALLHTVWCKKRCFDPKMQLDKETGLLMNFIDDLEKKYSSEVQTLSLGAFVTALKAANEKVRILTATRTDERMAKVVGALKALRKASDETYRQLVKFVNACALIEGDSKYLGFIDYVNTEIVESWRLAAVKEVT